MGSLHHWTPGLLCLPMGPLVPDPTGHVWVSALRRTSNTGEITFIFQGLAMFEPLPDQHHNGQRLLRSPVWGQLRQSPVQHQAYTAGTSNPLRSA